MKSFTLILARLGHNIFPLAALLLHDTDHKYATWSISPEDAIVVL